MQALKFNIFSPAKLLRYSFSKVRKGKLKYFAILIEAKTFIPEKYQALPPWTVIKQNDPFDYKLRSKDELIKEQAENPPNFPINLIYTDYPRATYEEVADKSRKVSTLKKISYRPKLS